MTTSKNNSSAVNKVSADTTPKGAKSDVLDKVSVVKPAHGTNGEKKTKSPAESSKKSESTKIDKIINPSAEDRLSKLKAFNKTSEKFKKLKEMQEEMDVFCASLDNTHQGISLFNSMDEEFKVTNATTFKKVVEVVREDLNLFTKEAEEEVLNFVI